VNRTAAQGAWSEESAPAWWHLARHVYDTAAVVGGSVSLRSTLTTAASIGRFVHRLPRGNPSARVLGELIAGDAALLETIASSMMALRYQNRALVPIVGNRGCAILNPLLEAGTTTALQRIQGPAVIATWHSGPAFGLGAALIRAGMPAFALRKEMPYARVTPLEYGLTHGTSEARAHTFARALSHLRQGGVVAIAVDVSDVALTAPVPCLNRMVRLARGPFALSRLSGAGVVPVVATWNARREISVVVGTVVSPPSGDVEPDAETIAAADVARQLDATIRALPHEIWFCMLRWLLKSPQNGPAVEVSVRRG